MKKNFLGINKISCFILSIILFFSLSACSADPQEIITTGSGTAFIKKITEDLDDVKGCKYETIRVAYTMFGKNFSMGPTDPSYRGIITLSEEEGERIFKEYNWLLDDTFTPDGMSEIDTSYLQGEEWYYCNDFDVHTFPTVIVNYVRFNGKDTIVFYVSSI